VKKGHYRGQSLVDLTQPLSDHDAGVCAKVDGPAPPVVQRPKYHGDDCPCISCCDNRASVDLYLRNLDLFNQNGFQ
jgi:hypothetical protein